MRHAFHNARRGHVSSKHKRNTAKPHLVEQLEGRTLLSAADLDATFGNDGFATSVPDVEFTATAMQADGKIIAVGAQRLFQQNETTDTDFVIARFNTNGSLDTTFGFGDGITQVDLRDNDTPVAVAITNDGRIVIAGHTTSTFDVGTDLAVARLLPNGAPDNSFSGDGKATFHVGATNEVLTDMALQADGKIVLIGTIDPSSALNDRQLVVGRLNANGSIDSGFGGNGTGYNVVTEYQYDLNATSVQVLPSGKIAVLGTASRRPETAASGEWNIHLAMFNSNGTKTGAPFGRGFFNADQFFSSNDRFVEVRRMNTTDLVVLPSGNLIVGANVDFRNTFEDVEQASLIVKFAPNGKVVDSHFDEIGVNTDTEVTSLAYTDGLIYVGGHYPTASFQISRYHANTLDPDVTFDPPLVDDFDRLHEASYSSPTFHTATSWDLEIDRNGRVYLAGASGFYNDEPGLPNYQQESVLLRIVGSAPTAPADVNDQFSEAIAIATDGIVSGSISNPVDVTMYKFTVVAGQTISFDIDNNGSPLDSYMRLFRSNGTQIAANDNAAAPGEQLHVSPYINYTFNTGGTYYVAISGKGNQNFNPNTGNGDTNGSTGSYTLTTIASDTNDTLATATSTWLNRTIVNQSMANANDVDMFEFTVTAGQRVGFDVDNNGSPLDSYMRLFNTNGTQLAANDNGIAPGETLHKSPYIAYTFATAGTYYVAVSGKGNQNYNPLTGLGDTVGSTGAFTLDLRIL